jgi:ABC-2 type transport system ATP-binding protein
MRQVLRDYAARGATVLVSSHLLAEVEQICSHVVVLQQGRLVAAGSVAEIVAGSRVVFTVDEPDRAATVLGALGGLTVTRVDQHSVHAQLDGLPRAAAVGALVDAGIGVDGVSAPHPLEEAFLQLVNQENTR